METGLLMVGGLLAVVNTMYQGEELSGQQLSVTGEGGLRLSTRACWQMSEFAR
jgi:hypothetical protein